MAQDTSEIIAVCGDDPGILCDFVFEQTGSARWAELTDWFVDRPLRVLFILVLAGIVNRILRGVVARFAEEVAERTLRPREEFDNNPVVRTMQRMGAGEEQRSRSRRRAITLGAMLESLVSILVWTTAAFMVLGEIGVSLGPLIASAGIAGIAIGFGAQSIVRDFLAGIFVIVEDQYGVGDVIDTGEAFGKVEEIGLRTTRVRDQNGVLWTVPNGVMNRVGNYSQIWSRSVFDIEVAYDTDIDHAMEVMKRVLDEVWNEQPGYATIIEEPEVQGVQSFSANGVVIRAVAKTDPAEQWAVARKIRARFKKAFDDEGIEIPFPQRTIHLADGATTEQSGLSS